MVSSGVNTGWVQAAAPPHRGVREAVRQAGEARVDGGEVGGLVGHAVAAHQLSRINVHRSLGPGESHGRHVTGCCLKSG